MTRHGEAAVGRRRGRPQIEKGAKMTPPARVTFEAQSPGDSGSMFRLLIDEKVVGENLTAAQLHILLGEILRMVALPKESTIPLQRRKASNLE
jgi:hypothetical protein